MIEVIRQDRLAQLRALLEILAAAIDNGPGARDLAQLSKQYRETLLEIEQIEGAEPSGDEISEILAGRAADGKSGAVRKNRAKVQKQ